MIPRSKPPSTQPHPALSADAAGLRYVTDDQPGLRRLRAGRSFRYVDARGKPVRDPATLKRIRALAIPPAWRDVWICPHESGHLQATGRDARGRKQHRYHPLWREVRDATKYERMIEFAEALPAIRRRVMRDLARPGLGREKVLAAMVRLMDLTFIRVGNEEYARNNDSYGLTALKDRHADIRGEKVRFTFRGKSGRQHAIEIADDRLARIVKKCQEIPGQDLFQFYDAGGRRRDVTSGDLNDYLREISGADFTAKDFRTWAGTVLATQALQGTTGFATQKQAQRNVRRAIEFVARQLGNTPAVCRKCYIHPFVIDGYVRRRLPCNGTTAPGQDSETIRASARPSASLGCDERQILEFLRCCRREEREQTRKDQRRRAKIPPAWRPRGSRGNPIGR